MSELQTGRNAQSDTTDSGRSDRRERGCLVQDLERIVAHVILIHLFTDHCLADLTLIETLLEQTKKQFLLIRVWMRFVVAQKSIFTKNLTPRFHDPGQRRKVAGIFPRGR